VLSVAIQLGLFAQLCQQIESYSVVFISPCVNDVDAKYLNAHAFVRLIFHTKSMSIIENSINIMKGSK